MYGQYTMSVNTPFQSQTLALLFPGYCSQHTYTFCLDLSLSLSLCLSPARPTGQTTRINRQFGLRSGGGRCPWALASEQSAYKATQYVVLLSIDGRGIKSSFAHAQNYHFLINAQVKELHCTSILPLNGCCVAYT